MIGTLFCQEVVPLLMRRTALLALLLLAFAPLAHATCGGGGGGGMGGMMPRPMGGMGQQPMPPRAYLVPWKVLKPGDAPLTTPMTLMWFPATSTDADLNDSRMLTLYSAQCIGMQLVKPDDANTIAKWNVVEKRPIALLVAGDKEIARAVPGSKNELLTNTENMLHDALWAREQELDAELQDGDRKAAAGDKDGAIAAYQKVWEQRCLLPKKGRAAQRALRKLGVTVKDAELRTSDPDLSPAMNAKLTAAMDRALATEIAAGYAKARALYAAAAKLDPADPVPPRFLGELYRHQTGEWELAMTTFQRVLAMQPDPLSRAVALHGIGKMTIHMGDSAKGLALFEQSIAAYPLALTYRNMAVYWNSERQRAKADAYVQQALALDPDEPYNLIFAATYLADTGRRGEALRIAKENESVLSASYNLAAIYALLGNKGKAMELLKRHFYEYERFDAVRAREMWEARVDYVFASMKDDPEFVKLTAMAR
jgi:tetratricopeptide (TPR) repeat protein